MFKYETEPLSDKKCTNWHTFGSKTWHFTHKRLLFPVFSLPVNMVGVSFKHDPEPERELTSNANTELSFPLTKLVKQKLSSYGQDIIVDFTQHLCISISQKWISQLLLLEFFFYQNS